MTSAGPDDVWAHLVRDWNTMFLNDTLRDVEKATGRPARAALAAPEGPTQLPTPSPFLPAFEAANAHELDRAAVEARVKAQAIDATDGLVFTIVVERLSKPESRACAWPAFYDAATREVLWTERVCKEPGGMGYRNYWFNGVRDAWDELVKPRLKKGEI